MHHATKLHFDQEKGIIRVTLEGRHTDRTIVAATRSIGHRPEMHRLWDVRNADLSGLDFTVIVGMTEDLAALPPLDPNLRVAIVTARDVQFGVSRMVEALLEGKAGGTIRVFRTVEDAEAWLAEPTRD